MKAGESNHNYIRNVKNKYRIMAEEKEISLKVTAERMMENRRKYGDPVNSNFIKIGEADRVAGTPPQDLNDEKIQISYNYGYFEKGSRVLEGHFASGRFDKSVQSKIGMHDIINNIPEKYIENLKKYPSYLEGRSYQIGQISYDYCLEHNISIDEYAQATGLFNSEINLSAFREGYEAREKEINHKHK